MAKKHAVFPGGKDTSTGPYSPGLICGDMVFVSGQGPLDVVTGKIVGDTIEEQAEYTIQNVKRVLEAAGCTLNDSVKATVHLADIGLYDRFNAVYARYFSEPRPVRTLVQSVLHDIQVEIDVIAIRGAS